MVSAKSNITLKEYQTFIRDVYGISNDRNFTTSDMLDNIERFVMRGLKGIRKKDKQKIKINLLISLSWFASLMGQFHIDLEASIWKRFSYICSYCGKCPCICLAKKNTGKPKKIKKDKSSRELRPETIQDFQNMFEKIYPSTGRSLESAGIHLAEEMGELSEAILNYRGSHKKPDFEKIKNEAADFFSCLVGVLNSLKINLAEELFQTFADNNCHVCHKMPCQCSFESVMNFKS